MTISTSSPNINPTGAIRAEALRLGFDVCGFASATAPWPASDHLAQFVAEGRHGQMDWMADTLERRSHPTVMWLGVALTLILRLSAIGFRIALPIFPTKGGSHELSENQWHH